MIVKLNNIGPLNNVEFDLNKDLIILCGPNNTGKTYAAYSIFGLYKLSVDVDTFLYMTTSNQDFQELKNLEKEGTIKINLIDLYMKYKDDLINAIELNFKHNLQSIFATTKNNFPKAEIKLILDEEYIRGKINDLVLSTSFRVRTGITLQILKEKNSNQIRVIYVKEEIDSNLEKRISNRVVRRFIIERIIAAFLNQIFNNVYITPSERSAINIFSKELSVRRNTLVDELLELRSNRKTNKKISLIEKRAQRYPWPIRESLKIAEDLTNLQKNTSDYKDFAKTFEKEILNGVIKVSKNGDVQFSPYRCKKKNIDIHLTGSMVKSLSNLVFYFRHLAHDEDLIIIDEPELNLHPDMQVIIARLLVRMVNAGFKVMISTHSDYIIRELNNLIMLKHSNNQELIDKYGYAQNELLDYNNVGAYLFNKKSAKKLAINEIGISINTMDEVITKLNQTAEEIYFSIQ